MTLPEETYSKNIAKTNKHTVYIFFLEFYGFRSYI